MPTLLCNNLGGQHAWFVTSSTTPTPMGHPGTLNGACAPGALHTCVCFLDPFAMRNRHVTTRLCWGVYRWVVGLGLDLPMSCPCPADLRITSVSATAYENMGTLRAGQCYTQARGAGPLFQSRSRKQIHVSGGGGAQVGQPN